VEHEDTILETYENADKISSLDHKVSRRSFLFAGLLSVIGVATAGSFFFPQNGKAQASGGVSNLVGSGSFDIGSKDYQIDTTGDLSLTDKGVPTSGAVKSFLSTQVTKSLKEIITKDGIAANYIKIDSKSLSFQTTNVQNAIEQLDTRIEVLQKDSHKPVTASDNSIVVGNEQQLKVNASGIPFNATINGGIVTNLQDFLNISTATLNTITSLGGVNEGVNEGQAAFVNRADLYNRKDGTRLYFRTLTSTDSSVLFTQAGDGKTVDLKINTASLTTPLPNNYITNTNLTANSVGTTNLINNSVTLSKLAPLSKNRILGYAGTVGDPTTGNVEELELGNGLEFDTSVTPNKLVVNLATSIPNLPVNSISNVGPVSLVGNSSGVTAAAQTIALGNDFLFDTLTNPTLPQLKLNPTSTSAIWSLQNVPVPTYVTLNNPNLIVRFAASNKIGIGTTTPGTNLVIDTGASANSGLQLSQLNSASLPIASSSILGVDAGGKVNKIGTLTGNANKFLQINPTGDGLISTNLQAWSTTGNTALTSDFIGTLNAQPLLFKYNNNPTMFMGDGKLTFYPPSGSTISGPTLEFRVNGTFGGYGAGPGAAYFFDNKYNWGRWFKGVGGFNSSEYGVVVAPDGKTGIGIPDSYTSTNTTLPAQLTVFGGLRAAKGDPNSFAPATDTANVGYSFANDGDSGFFAYGGTANGGSSMMVKSDNAVLLFAQPNQVVKFPGRVLIGDPVVTGADPVENLQVPGKIFTDSLRLSVNPAVAHNNGDIWYDGNNFSAINNGNSLLLGGLVTTVGGVTMIGGTLFDLFNYSVSGLLSGTKTFRLRSHGQLTYSDPFDLRLNIGGNAIQFKKSKNAENSGTAGDGLNYVDTGGASGGGNTIARFDMGSGFNDIYIVDIYFVVSPGGITGYMQVSAQLVGTDPEGNNPQIASSIYSFNTGGPNNNQILLRGSNPTGGHDHVQNFATLSQNV
jgi:hypothetical protein